MVSVPFFMSRPIFSSFHDLPCAISWVFSLNRPYHTHSSLWITSLSHSAFSSQSWTPHHSLLKGRRGGGGRGVGPSKNWVTWGVPKLLLERADNSEKRGGGVDVEIGDCHFLLLYSSIAFTVKVVCFITFWFFSLLS